MQTSIFKDKNILITGGTGSFGKGFTKYLLKNYSPKKIAIFSRDEFKQYHMSKEIEDKRLRFFIGDVRDLPRLETAFNGVDIVIHAAALKQVPTVEYNPFEAVKTNVLGTQNVIEAAISRKVSKVILISTDKAVLPVNLYGATKLTAEKLFISSNVYSPKETKFSVVRYGNVIGSRGSVVELLLKNPDCEKVQITDLTMTRFWLALKQSFQLVHFALDRMEGREIFVPKIPSMKIVDLFDVLAPKAQREVIGIRPGEKLHEILITSYESSRTLDMGDYYVVLPELSFSKKNLRKHYADGKFVKQGFTFTSDGNDRWLTKKEIIELIKETL